MLIQSIDSNSIAYSNQMNKISQKDNIDVILPTNNTLESYNETKIIQNKKEKNTILISEAYNSIGLGNLLNLTV